MAYQTKLSEDCIVTKTEAAHAIGQFHWHFQGLPLLSKKSEKTLIDMPALKNLKHEAFAQAVALSTPAAKAYRDGWNCTPESAETAGPRLANRVEVMSRIEELRAKVAEKADRKFDMSKDKWLERLARIAASAEEVADFSAATGALREIGRGAGHYAPEKVEHSGATEIVIRKL
jgi:hypothetical protein